MSNSWCSVMDNGSKLVISEPNSNASWFRYINLSSNKFWVELKLMWKRLNKCRIEKVYSYCYQVWFKKSLFWYQCSFRLDGKNSTEVLRKHFFIVCLIRLFFWKCCFYFIIGIDLYRKYHLISKKCFRIFLWSKVLNSVNIKSYYFA